MIAIHKKTAQPASRLAYDPFPQTNRFAKKAIEKAR